MKEIRQIIAAYEAIHFRQHAAALLTVVRVEGSSYRRTGARMLVRDDGIWTGGISGGCLEGDALRRAQQAMARNRPSTITYDTTQDDAHQVGVGLGCNGIIDVLITPLHPGDPHNPVEVLQKSLRAERSTQVLLTVTESSDATLPLGRVYAYQKESTLSQYAELAAYAERLLTDIAARSELGKSCPVTYTSPQGQVTIFIEIIPPAIQLYVYGGNYDVYPLVRIAKEVGWRVAVYTNPNKVRKSLFATADAVIDHRSAAVPTVDDHTAAILMAHDYATDLRHLQQLLLTDIPYIGLLGPRKRSEKMFDALRLGDTPLANPDRIYAPTGLDIGAVTPEEIAVSILAEIRAVFSGRQGRSLRQRSGPIHEREKNRAR